MNQADLKNTITEMKNTLEGLNSRLTNTEEQTSELKDRLVEVNQPEQQQQQKTHTKKEF